MAAGVWAYQTSREVDALRQEVATRVRLLEALHETQVALERSPESAPLTLTGLGQAPSLEKYQKAYASAATSVARRDVVLELVPVVRRQTGQISARLSRRWDDLDRLSIIAIGLAALNLLLLLALRRGSRRAATEADRRRTAERDFEQQLRVTDRLASIGTMTAGLVHEINNPLQWLLNNLTLLKQELDGRATSGTRLEGVLHDAIEGAEGVQRIARDLRTVSHVSDAPRVAVDLSQVVSAAVRMARHQIVGRGELEVSVARELPIVSGVASQLAQVFVNLLLNAAQALHEGRATAAVAVRAYPAQQGVYVEVEDNGPGVPEALQPSLFEPFFTTKPPGEGTGLGLYVCRQIVTDHGGTIELHSEGPGTLVRVWLPARAVTSVP